MRALIALDGSGVADIVLAEAAPWLRASKAHVDLLTVLDASEVRATAGPGPWDYAPAQVAEGGQLFSRSDPPALTEDRTQAIRRSRDERQQRLEQLAAEHLAGLDCGVHVIASDSAAEAIVEQARTLDADAIIIGTHGRSGLRRVLMGSVAEAVLRNSPVPVLMVCQNMGPVEHPALAHAHER
ncbi:MAG: universal stress protein [Dehalococcoidia bacterium]